MFPVRTMNGPAMAVNGNKIIIERVENPSEQEEELSKMAKEGVQETLSEEIFIPYDASALPQSYAALKHPGDIVEAGSLAAQRLPAVEYDITSSFPKEVIAEGKLSDLQLEGILYACQRHQKILPNGTRAGFFIGDGAGVGKGRQVAGIIFDSFVRGRCRNIWFSISTDLRIDAQRDLHDIGCYIKVIDGCQELDKETRVFGLPKDFTEGVVFSTYATLVSFVQKGVGSGKQSRLKQLIDWCGGDTFEGCLIFDECHKAKHFLPGNEKSSTKVALAVTEIQRMLPKARVVYCSATGVTDVKNMAFMERLGLWGSGTAFKDFTPFLDSITRRGLGTLEMLAMEMKASGMYISRGLSYRQTEFMNVEANLTDAQVKVWDQAVHVWNELRRSLLVALGRTKTVQPRMWTQFWACHQRFFKQLCMSMKVPKIVEEAKQALNDGYCVVIGLQTTGEASLGQEISRCGGTVNKFISLTREILRRFIEQHFPTEVHLNPRERKVDQWSEQAKNMLLGFADKISLPNSPLDEMIDLLGGPGMVAEMTGRSGRVVRPGPKSEPRYESRAAASGSVESLNVQERNSFMAGNKLVAIISDAASTGISLHADHRAENKRRRIHLTAELPWSADKAVQQLGRSHRSNQSSGPIYKLVTTNLGGERRFAAAVAKRLQSLGALTKGDRRAASAADLSEYNFDSIYGRLALRTMYTSIAQHTFFKGVMFSDVLECAHTSKEYTLEEFHNMLRECLIKMDMIDTNILGATVKQSEAGNVSKFLNRILGLTVERQNLIFSYFYEGMKSLIRAAKRDGRYNEGVTDVRGNSIKLVQEPVIVFSEAQISSVVTKHVVLSIDRGLSWEKALNLQESHSGNLDGFYCSKKEQRGRRLYLLAIEKDQATNLFIIYRPNTGMSPFEETKDDLLQKYGHVQASDAESGWKLQYEKTESSCIHGSNCKSGPACSVGCRITHLHLLCGGIISLLSTLELVVNRYAEGLGLTRENRALRVVRVELDDGQKLIGLKYPDVLISEVSKLLKDQKANSNDRTEYSMVIENASSVSEYLRSKATTPPLTLKNFFKVKKKDSVDREVGVCIHDDVKTDNCKEGTDTIGEGSSEIEEAAKKLKPRNSQNPVVGKKEKTSVYFKRSSSSIESKTFKQKSLSVKRNASCNLLPDQSKRQKQSNLMNSFQKRKPSKSLDCPICEIKFDVNLSNEEINKHIDGCLIE
ncbi:uncharacterized protein LOC135684506 [Rhopilema esculentum]|uniref:uncharacterized protein LOC135684506 n=1 Tax=Rhopilema esculentum TaxID=499914 RepID=UPI0031D1640D|eukprot:gene16188-7557_t